jgi:hypothetical protein
MSPDTNPSESVPAVSPEIAVPAGWVRPARWPSQRPEEVRAAVLHVFQSCCQRCRRTPARCVTSLDPAGRRSPGDLVLICHTCLLERRSWSPPEVHALRDLAQSAAAAVKKMVGWDEPAPARPPKKTSPRHLKRAVRDPQTLRTVSLHFKLSPLEVQELKRAHPNRSLALAARAQLLAHRPDFTALKRHLLALFSQTDPIVEDLHLEVEELRAALLPESDALQIAFRTHQGNALMVAMEARSHALARAIEALDASIAHRNQVNELVQKLFDELS